MDRVIIPSLDAMAGTVLRMTTVADQGLDVQVWWGNEPYDPSRVNKGGWPQGARHKPEGGFFTSSRRSETSDWIEYQKTTCRATEKRSAQFLLPDPEAVLYVISSPHDYETLVQAYPHRQLRPEPCPDWQVFFDTESPDAVHVTASAIAQGRPWFAKAWATESTAWFRPTLTLVEQP